MRTLVAAIVVLLAFVAPAEASRLNPHQYQSDTRGNYADPQVGKLASMITGRDITALCTPPSILQGSSLGYSADGGATWTFQPIITIDQEFCAAFERLLAWQDNRSYLADWNDRLTVGLALLDITHESMHIKLASVDEGTVECTAYRNLWPTVAALGLPARLASLVLASAQRAHTMSSKTYDGTDIPNPYRSVC